MPTLPQLLDQSLLAQHLESGVVKEQFHPDLPLRILNYGQRAQFEGIWDDVTCLTRGLILNDSAVVARPFRKFFNVNHTARPETLQENLPKSAPEVTEKMDGSLGILWRFKGQTGVATRGSFTSGQAKWATAWYAKHMKAAKWPEGWTPLFEIVYPENRIVVKYDWAGLILLSLVNNETGAEMLHADVRRIGTANGMNVVPSHTLSLDECRAHPDKNFEGFVLTWHSPYLKVKVKLDEYVRMHHVITGFSPIRLWECLRFGWELDSYRKDMPADFLKWIALHEELLRTNYRKVEEGIAEVWAGRPTDIPSDPREARKTLAAYFTKGRNKAFAAFCFAKLDGKSYADDIWKTIRPHGTHPWKQVDE